MSIHDEAQRLREKLEKINATKVRIALFGQPGAGKSSLINTLCGANVAEVGVANDTTTTSNEYAGQWVTATHHSGCDALEEEAKASREWETKKADAEKQGNTSGAEAAAARIRYHSGWQRADSLNKAKKKLDVSVPDGLAFVDLPGFGTDRFPAHTYWKLLNIEAFDLFLCTFTMRFHADDTELFGKLRTHSKVVLYISNRHDQLWQDGKSTEQLERELAEDARKQTGAAEAEIFFTSCKNKTGIDKLWTAIRGSLDAAKAERWARSAAAYTQDALEAKRSACETEVMIAAGLSAANALNPIPGVDMAVDMGVLGGLFVRLRQNYGLTDERLSMAEGIPAVAPVAQELLSLATKEGLLILLKKFAGQEAVKEITKWIPFVGQAIAAVIGFGVTSSAGGYYHERCYDVAKAILDKKLQQKSREAA